MLVIEVEKCVYKDSNTPETDDEYFSVHIEHGDKYINTSCDFSMGALSSTISRGIEALKIQWIPKNKS